MVFFRNSSPKGRKFDCNTFLIPHKSAAPKSLTLASFAISKQTVLFYQRIQSNSHQQPPAFRLHAHSVQHVFIKSFRYLVGQTCSIPCHCRNKGEKENRFP